jgi:hypothetical protein
MTKHRIINLTLISVIAVALVLAFASSFAMADTENSLSLTIESKIGGNPIANEHFDLYQVAQIDDNGSIVANEDFADYDVNFDSANEEDWQATAEALATYIERDGLAPDMSGETDQNGILNFSEGNSDLTEAVYLVIGEPLDNANGRYTCEPFFVSVPDEENGVSVYDVTVGPKILSDDIPVYSTVTVVKVWDDEDAEADRPDSIEVQLLKDGKVYDTVTLNKKNNWHYTWEKLDSAVEWKVVEKDVPDGYEVGYTIEGDIHTLTNTLEDNPNDDPTPNTTTTVTKKLPRTGLYWVPVPVLMFLGLAFIIIGLVRYQRKGKGNE